MSEQQKSKYITKAIAEELKPEIQVIIWSFMDSLVAKRKDKMDYLQVFKITTDKKEIRIINKQEQPYMGEEYFLNNDDNDNLAITVWTIDEPDKQTLLFPSDY